MNRDVLMRSSNRPGLRAASRRRAPVSATLIVFALAACGGGSSTPPATDAEPPAASPAPAPAAVPVAIRGVAATGAPLAGAAIRVFDATGATVCEATADAAGAYACTLGAAPKTPLLVRAERDDVTLFSALGEPTSGTVNVTPITQLIVATLAADGDPQALMTRLAAGQAPFTAAALGTAVERVTGALKPLTDRLGATIDPIRGTFSADGTGHDKVLDALQVSIRPAGSTSNVEVTVKTVPGSEDAAPIAISFQANAATIPAMPSTGDLGALPTVNVPAAIADLAARMNGCVELPPEQRVSNGATLVASECRSLFSQDDPSRFLANGTRVGPLAGAAYSFMFVNAAIPVRYEAGMFDFYRANGDWVVTYRTTSTGGAVSFDQVVARVESGKLKLVGNQYAYGAAVRPIVQRREYLNTPAATSLTVGYNVSISNRVDGSGNSVFTKVEVTSPRGNTLTYLPSPGLGNLLLAKPDGTASTTSVIRLAGRLTDPAQTAHPADVDPALYFADRTLYTDEVIRTIPDQGVWRMTFFHADGSPNVVQAYRTVSRAMTLAEAAQARFAEPLQASKDALRARSAANGYGTFTASPSAETPQYADLRGADGGAWWAVPAGAVAPSTVSVYGRATTSPTSPRYNDALGVAPSARSAVIRCSAQSLGDPHCAAAPFRDQYATGATFNAIELWGRDARQTEVSSMTALYKVTIPTQP